MHKKILPLILAILISLISSPAEAQWPTTVRENLPVSASPDFAEWRPYAFPYPDGSTIAVFARAPVGNSYQIIDRYGYLRYPEPQSLWPAVNSPYTNFLKAIPDGQGGVLACWECSYPPIEEGIYAQRVDSLGNICWGDSAKRIYPVSYHDFDVCPDGEGGFYFVISFEESPPEPHYVRIQHIDEFAQPFEIGADAVTGEGGAIAAMQIENQFDAILVRHPSGDLASSGVLANHDWPRPQTTRRSSILN